VVVFVRKHAFADCLRGLRGVVGPRLITGFFDLTKNPAEDYPWADRVRTLDCARWLREAARIPWDRVAEAVLLIHPDGE
jgi:hypothetical protein